MVIRRPNDNLVRRKFSIKLEDLPFTSSSAQHIVRFRVVSEDRNRVSDWSPIFVFDSPGQTPSSSVQYALTSSSVNGSTILNLIWSGEYVRFHKDLDAESHDVFIKWNSDSYLYSGRIVGNSLQIFARQLSSSASFIVQLPSYPSDAPPGTEPRLNSKIQILKTDTIVY
jgi:hypothetical protein